MQVCKFICVNKALQTCGLVGCSCNAVALANLGTQVGDKVTIKLPNAHTNVTICVLACFSTTTAGACFRLSFLWLEILFVMFDTFAAVFTVTKCITQLHSDTFPGSNHTCNGACIAISVSTPPASHADRRWFEPLTERCEFRPVILVPWPEWEFG